MRDILIMVGLAMLFAPSSAPAGKWERFDSCVLAEDQYQDGDSFHVYVEGNKRRHYIFRLYYVDAPEIDRSYPDRNRDQAKYWNLDEKAIPALGKEAAKCVREKLARPFTVYTRKEDARGRSKRPRYYAMIKTSEGWLSEQLISAGLARRYGRWVDELPDGVSDTRFGMRLKKMEKDARGEAKGAWAGAAAGKKTPARAAPSTWAGREFTLGKPLVIYADRRPLLIRGRLPAGNTVKVIEEQDGYMLRISFTSGGKPFTGLCRRSGVAEASAVAK